MQARQASETPWKQVPQILKYRRHAEVAMPGGIIQQGCVDAGKQRYRRILPGGAADTQKELLFFYTVCRGVPDGIHLILKHGLQQRRRVMGGVLFRKTAGDDSHGSSRGQLNIPQLFFNAGQIGGIGESGFKFRNVAGVSFPVIFSWVAS